ncbi:MAG: WecB/TagA/CpsF family glycosyltransferase [Bacteroidales bacterium]|nr:WecB/TagA/CpsF family glycosyltransferase [Bacteroidales bacterium]
MKESYFGITCEFNPSDVIQEIENQVAKKQSGYVVALDGNNFAIAQQNVSHRDLINSAVVTHCDSSWLPLFINKVHKTSYKNFYSADLFFDLLRRKKFRHYFLGSTRRVLDALRENLKNYDEKISEMQFVELPFCAVEEFDYFKIAEEINADAPDLIWVSLGCPKQEQFMQKLLPHLNKGVLFGSGALFNFYCGLKDVPQRAPQWIINCRLEFLYRIFSEPRKQIKRCVGIIRALPKAILEEKRKAKICNS